MDIPSGTAVPHWAYQNFSVCLVSFWHSFGVQCAIVVRSIQCHPRTTYRRCVHCDTPNIVLLFSRRPRIDCYRSAFHFHCGHIDRTSRFYRVRRRGWDILPDSILFSFIFKIYWRDCGRCCGWRSGAWGYRSFRYLALYPPPPDPSDKGSQYNVRWNRTNQQYVYYPESIHPSCHSAEDLCKFTSYGLIVRLR